MPAPVPSLCPGCAPLVIERVVDGFGFCTEERFRVGPDEATDTGLTQSQVLPLVSGERTLPMTWSAWHPAGVSGFAKETSLRLNVTVTHAQIVRGVSKAPGAPRKCRDQLELVADVSVATLDGALSGVFEGITIVASSRSHAAASATADLRGFQGSLKIPFDPKQSRKGQVSLDLDFRPDGWAGSLQPMLTEVVERTDAAAPFAGHAGGGSIRAKWPNDGCEPSQRAAAADSRPRELGGRSVAEVFEQAKAAIQSKNPLQGNWGKTRVGVTFELLELASTCIRFAEPHVPTDTLDFSFRARARVSTSNGRVSSEAIARMGASFEPDGKLQSASLEWEGPQLPASEFAERAGVRGIDFHGLPCGALRYVALYERSRTKGQLGVIGLRCDEMEGAATLEHVAWCKGFGCEPGDNRPWWYPSIEERAASDR